MYITEDEFQNFLESSIPIQKYRNSLDRYKRWSQTYSKPMEGGGYYMSFEYNVIGISPFVYIFPEIVIYQIMGKTNKPVEFIYDDPETPFNTEKLKNIGDRYGMRFTQYKGKGPNKRPIHRVILRKFTDIENSYFYLKEYISLDDIVIETVEGLRSPENKELFDILGKDKFYMSSWATLKDSDPWNPRKWIFSLEPDFSELTYINRNILDSLL